MPDNETKWVLDASLGDSRAFAKLVDAYTKPVYNLCYRMLGNPQDAEDAAQEAFLRAFRNIERYDPTRKFATWLLSIAANHCIDLHRKVRPVQIEYDETPPGRLLEPRSGPEKRLIAKQASDEVQKLLNSLVPQDRAAMVLYYWYEYSLAEIGQQLKLSEAAVKARMHRARRSLAKAWQESNDQLILAPRRDFEKAIP